jgi:hypothetical protein
MLWVSLLSRVGVVLWVGFGLGKGQIVWLCLCIKVLNLFGCLICFVEILDFCNLGLAGVWRCA